MTTIRHRIAATVILATALPLSACSDDTTDTTDTTTVTATETVEASPETSTSADSTVTVSSTGDGPVGLTTADTLPGDTTGFSGRLITGPGSCFALAEFGGDGAPRTLVFPAGTEFVTRDGRPSVTMPGRDAAYVGQPLDVDGTDVPVTDLAGFPDACSRGGTGTALVVD